MAQYFGVPTSGGAVNITRNNLGNYGGWNYAPSSPGAYFVAIVDPYTSTACDTYWTTGVGSCTHYTSVSYTIATSTATTTPPCTQNCNSNVLFLPGIEGSRLYDAGNGGAQLWEPHLGSDISQLYLNAGGTSTKAIFTKDIVDTANVNPTHLAQIKIYQSFLDDLNTWKNTDHIIADYGVTPYDWRVSLNDIVNYGNQLPSGDIYYASDLRATSTPYIMQELKHLAETSRTGKVTIVAHSNGGLVAKALIKKLQDTHDPLISTIDTLVLVDVPQVGTPAAIGAALHGFGQGLPQDWFSFLLTPTIAREFASTSPMAYHLLPSASYFSGNGITATTPPVTFEDGALTQRFITKYGHAIGNSTELSDFLLGKDGRPRPARDDLQDPLVLSPSLLSYATSMHATLDNDTVIPAGITVHEIGGWGNETLSSIKYSTGIRCASPTPGRICPSFISSVVYTPETVVDGDGTVITASSLAMSTSNPNVHRWWVDLEQYNGSRTNKERTGRVDHKNIFEIPTLRDLIKNLIEGNSTSTPQYISPTQPPTPSTKRLHFTLHSPLTLGFTDAQGNYTGATATSTSFNVPDVDYQSFGEVQWLSVPEDLAGQVVMHGTGTGSFALDVAEVSGNTTLATTTFAAIPSATSTIATITIDPAVSVTASSTLVVDYTGQGTATSTYQAIEGSVVVPDITPPKTTLTATSTRPAINGWYTTDVSLTFDAVDATSTRALEQVSGIAQTYFSIDNATTTVGTSTVLTTDGSHTIRYYSVDNAGNRAATSTATIRIDKTPPATSIVLTGIKGSNGWYKSAVQVVLKPTDTRSGVDKTYFAIDNATTTTVGTSTSFTTDGMHTIRYYSTDKVGNTASTTTTKINIDKTAPEATFTISTSTKNIVITGLDTLSSTTVSKTATSTTITDKAGNTAKVLFQKTFIGTLLTKLLLTSIQYGTSTPSTLTSSFTYTWATTTKSTTLANQTLIVDATTTVNALYATSTNKTMITVIKSGVTTQATTLAGLIPIRVVTNKGGVNYLW